MKIFVEVSADCCDRYRFAIFFETLVGGVVGHSAHVDHAAIVRFADLLDAIVGIEGQSVVEVDSGVFNVGVFIF